MNKYVQDKNYDLEWMEMDGDYNQNIATELRWTYLEEPNCKDDLMDMMDHAHVCIISQEIVSMILCRHAL